MSKLLCKPIQKNDAELLLAWRNHPTAREFSRNQEEILLKDHLDWLKDYLGDTGGKGSIFMYTHDGIEIGMARLDFISKTICEISVLVGPQFQGKGYGVQIISDASNIALNKLGLRQIIAVIHELNLRSLNSFKKCGYVVSANNSPFLTLQKHIVNA